MFGASVQGHEHVRFAAQTMADLATVIVYDVREEAVDALIAKLQDELPFTHMKGESVDAVVKSTEVLSSAAVILKKPLAAVKDEWVTPGRRSFRASSTRSRIRAPRSVSTVHRRQHRGARALRGDGAIARTACRPSLPRPARSSPGSPPAATTLTRSS
jgi:hypothetical protein